MTTNDNLIINDNEYALSSTTTTSYSRRWMEEKKRNPSLLANDQMTSWAAEAMNDDRNISRSKKN